MKFYFFLICIAFVICNCNNQPKTETEKTSTDSARSVVESTKKEISPILVLTEHADKIATDKRGISWGVNEINGSFCGPCITFKNTEAELISTGSSQDVSFKLTRIDNFSDLRRTLEIHASISLGFGIFSSDMSMDIFRSVSFSSFNQYLVVEVDVLNSPQLLKSVSLNKTGEQRVQEGFESFIKNCGTKYILGKQMGGKLIGIIQFEAKDSRESETIKASLDASIGVWGSFKGDFASNLNAITKYKSLKVNVYRSGGKGAMPITVDSLETVARNFPDEINKNPQMVYAITQDYYGVPQYPGYFDTDKKNYLIKEYDYLADWMDECEQYYYDIRYMKSHPLEFNAAVKEKQQSLTTKMLETSDSYRNYIENLQNYFYNPSLRIKKPLRPAPPNFEIIEKDQNWVHFQDEVYIRRITSPERTTEDLHLKRCGYRPGNPCDDKWQLENYTLNLNASSADVKLANAIVTCPTGWEWNWFHWKEATYTYNADSSSVTCIVPLGSHSQTIYLEAEEYRRKK